MGRPLRIQFPGACYYVKVSSREPIFSDEKDRQHFLDLLKGYKERNGLKVFAYCLLPNEAHLVFQTLESNLSRVMQNLNTAYTKYFVRRHRTPHPSLPHKWGGSQGGGRNGNSGSVMRGRFKSYLVDQEKCLMPLTRYVHLLPARQNEPGNRKESLVLFSGKKSNQAPLLPGTFDSPEEKVKIRGPWRYAWSSSSAYIENKEKYKWVDSEEVLGLFAKHRLTQSVRYLNYLKDGLQAVGTERPVVPTALGMALSIISGRFIGDTSFASKMMAQVKGERERSGGGEEKIEEILKEIALKHRIDESEILGPSRWRNLSSVRKEVICRAWKHGVGITQIGKFFQRTPGAISQIVHSQKS